ncbi:MAG: uroporphyrinogen decarboxylase family protein [Candidatus Hermodarchaeota archaeon]
MNSYERVNAALNLEEPDRVPIFTHQIDGNLADEVLGKKRRSTFEVVEDLAKENPNWLEMVNEIISDLEINVFSKGAIAATQLGFDVVTVGYIPFIIESMEEMTDIFGKKHKIKNINGNIYPDYYGGAIKNRSDWENYPKPNFKEIYKNAKKFYRGVVRRCKKANCEIFLIAQNSLASVFPPVWQGMGMGNFARALKNDPKLVKERFDYTTEFVLTAFKAYKDCGAKVFQEGGDIAFRSGPMINPKYFNEYLLPCYQEVADQIHDWGGKYILHTDGDITTLLDFIVESRFDALQCLELPFVDPYYVKKQVGDKLCLIGNIDTKHILVDATKEEVEIAVTEAIKALGQGGGFMISPSNFHPEISIDRLKWMVEYTKKIGSYPLNQNIK